MHLKFGHIPKYIPTYILPYDMVHIYIIIYNQLRPSIFDLWVKIFDISLRVYIFLGVWASSTRYCRFLPTSVTHTSVKSMVYAFHLYEPRRLFGWSCWWHFPRIFPPSRRTHPAASLSFNLWFRGQVNENQSKHWSMDVPYSCLLPWRIKKHCSHYLGFPDPISQETSSAFPLRRTLHSWSFSLGKAMYGGWCGQTRSAP